MTETQRSWWSVDLETLATKERVEWSGDDVGQLSTAHAQRDPAGGGWINVGTQIAPPLWSQYHIFRLSDDAPAERQILASIPCADGAAPNWLHSFALTKDKVVVFEQPAAYSVAAMVGLASASHGSIQWSPEEGTRVHVLDRATNALTTHVVEPAFFFFHVANAFDAPDGSGDVMVDLCSFDGPEIVTALRLDRLTDDALATDLPESRLVRLTVSAGGGPPTTRPLDDVHVTGGFSDLPTIAPGVTGVPSYRFVYSIGAARPTVVSNRLVKTDVSGRGGDAAFEVEGMLPGEPLFVPRPGGTEEDDGVVLAIGTDPEGTTSLYVLDARTMRLVARCRSAIALPAGFHEVVLGRRVKSERRAQARVHHLWDVPRYHAQFSGDTIHDTIPWGERTRSENRCRRVDSEGVIVKDRRRITGTSIREYRAHDPSFFVSQPFSRAPPSARAPRVGLAAPRSCTLAGRRARRTQNTDTQRLTA